MRSLSVFLLLGALLFAIDRAAERVSGTAAPRFDDSRRSGDGVPTPERDIRLLAAAGRRAGLDRGDPVIVSRLVRNLRFLGHDGSDAALYREALALGMDRSDVVVERRLADRMAARLRADALRERPADAELRRWYAQHRERWRRPPAVAFTHAFVSRERHGAGAEAAARELLAALRAERVDPGSAPARGDPFLLAGQVPLRRLPDLAHQFGRAFAEAVATAAPHAWSEPIESSYGLHLVWVHEQRAEAVPLLDEVRAQVVDAWREEAGNAGLENALVALRAGRNRAGGGGPE